MAMSKAKREKQDEIKARSRYVDQPGQWVDITPANVKKRQQKDWDKFFAMVNGKNKPAAKKKK